VGLSPLAGLRHQRARVCGLVGMSLALAATVNVGFGLVAVYLVILNGLIHVVQAVISRGYNQDWEPRSPCLFRWADTVSPLSIGLVARASLIQMTGAVAAIGIHVAIIVHAMRRRVGL